MKAIKNAIDSSAQNIVKGFGFFRQLILSITKLYATYRLDYCIDQVYKATGGNSPMFGFVRLLAVAYLAQKHRHIEPEVWSNLIVMQ